MPRLRSAKSMARALPNRRVKTASKSEELPPKLPPHRSRHQACDAARSVARDGNQHPITRPRARAVRLSARPPHQAAPVRALPLIPGSPAAAPGIAAHDALAPALLRTMPFPSAVPANATSPRVARPAHAFGPRVFSGLCSCHRDSDTCCRVAIACAGTVARCFGIAPRKFGLRRGYSVSGCVRPRSSSIRFFQCLCRRFAFALIFANRSRMYSVESPPCHEQRPFAKTTVRRHRVPRFVVPVQCP